jgi:hypothetical protein
MSRPTLPKLFHLKRREELLAVLESCGPGGEMFWLTCAFKPTDLFKEVESLFREATDTEDMDVWEENYDKLISQGVRLHDMENMIEIKYFTIHIDGDRVDLRYAEPPYIDE